MPVQKYSVCWLYWYKSTNFDDQGEEEAAAEANEEEEIAYESLLCASTGLENEDDGVQRHLQYASYLLYWRIEYSLYLLY